MSPSTAIISPGPMRPDSTISLSGMSNTPTSELMITRPSEVTW